MFNVWLNRFYTNLSFKNLRTRHSTYLLIVNPPHDTTHGIGWQTRLMIVLPPGWERIWPDHNVFDLQNTIISFIFMMVLTVLLFVLFSWEWYPLEKKQRTSTNMIIRYPRPFHETVEKYTPIPSKNNQHWVVTNETDDSYFTDIQ